METEEEHYGQAVAARRWIVEEVLLANDQRLVVGGSVEEAAVLLVGELIDDRVGQGDRLIESRL